MHRKKGRGETQVGRNAGGRETTAMHSFAGSIPEVTEDEETENYCESSHSQQNRNSSMFDRWKSLTQQFNRSHKTRQYRAAGQPRSPRSVHISSFSRPLKEPRKTLQRPHSAASIHGITTDMRKGLYYGEFDSSEDEASMDEHIPMSGLRVPSFLECRQLSASFSAHCGPMSPPALTPRQSPFASVWTKKKRLSAQAPVLPRPVPSTKVFASRPDSPGSDYDTLPTASSPLPDDRSDRDQSPLDWTERTPWNQVEFEAAQDTPFAPSFRPAPKRVNSQHHYSAPYNVYLKQHSRLRR